MRPVDRTSPPDAFCRVAVFEDHPPALIVALAPGASAAAAEVPRLDDDDWADTANTPITASGRRKYITDAMMNKFGASMGCPRCGHAHTCVSSAHAQQCSVADFRRATGTRD